MNQPLLPHGPGFRLIDEISAPEAGPLLRGRVWLNPDWPIFRDHFPERPLLPAVYFAEMGAQTAGALWAAHAGFSPATPLQLVEIKKFRVRQPAFPGQNLQIVVRVATAWPELATFQVQIFRDETLLAEGEIVMAHAKPTT
jgi:3-hydroxymyristoyl/3-hydroxydecanoyl-(acyl carrier protein) dehydratase